MQDKEDSLSTLSLSDRLNLDRTRVAYEGLMMTWVRTAISLITFGFAIYKFFEFEMSGLDIGPRLLGTREFALVLIVAGILTLVAGLVEHRRDLNALRKDYPGMPMPGTKIAAIVTVTLGLLALLAVILRV